MFVLRYVAAALGAVTLVGCGGTNLGEVEGTVKLKGKPIDKIMVEFWPDGGGPRAYATSDDQGRYILTTDDGKRQGAVIGPNKVVLRDIGVLGDKFLGRAGENVDMSKGRKPRLPPEYGDLTKTPMRKEVTAGKSVIDLEVP